MASRLFGPPRRRPDRGRRPHDRVLPAAPSRRREGRRALLRPAEAARRRDGVHGRAAARAARRAGGRREPHHAGEPARAAARHQRRAGRHLRGDRAQHGVRHVAVHARSSCSPRAGSSPRARPRRSAAIRTSSRPILDTEPDPRRSTASSAGYGKMTILNGTTFAVGRGAITTVIGPNGAGKSTVFKTVFGLLPARSGPVALRRRATSRTGRRAALLAAGICYVPQGRNIFPELSVRAQSRARRRRRGRRNPRPAGPHRGGAGALSGAAAQGRPQASTLSGGEQKQLEIVARAAARSEADADRRAVDRPVADAGGGDRSASCRSCATRACRS